MTDKQMQHRMSIKTIDLSNDAERSVGICMMSSVGICMMSSVGICMMSRLDFGSSTS